MEPQLFNKTLGSFSGTISYHIHRVLNGSRLFLTDGCHFVLEEGQACWLFDIILLYQSSKEFKDQWFQVWRLMKQKDDTWLITCTDGNDNTLMTQHIPYSDFPVDEITIWKQWDVALLPSEH